MNSLPRLLITTCIVVVLTAVSATTVILSQIHEEAVNQAMIDMDRRIGTFWELVRQKGDSFRIVDGKLLIGNYVVNDNYELPDKIKEIFGGTATIFMGDTRVTTNVLKDDGTRAVGTKLVGEAYDAIFVKGKPYRGEAAILGKPYLTAYDPIKNAKGETIGVLYVGVRKNVFLSRYHELQLSALVIVLVIVSVFSVMYVLLIRSSRKADALQRKNLLFLQTLMDTIPNPIFYKDAQGIYLGCNSAFASYIGISRDDIVGKSVFDVAPPEMAAVYKQSDQDLLSAPPGTMQQYETQIRDAQGNMRDAIFFKAVFFEENGTPGGMVGSLLDISDRKHVEEALLQSEERLKEAQRIALLGCWSLDIVTNHLEWSEEVFEIFDIDPRQHGPSYEKFLETVHPDDRNAVHEAYTESLQKREPYDFIHRLLLPNGHIKYVHERCQTYYDEDGTPLRSLGTVQDVTDRYQAEAAIKRIQLQQQAILDTIPDMVWLKDQDNRFAAVNQAFGRACGLSPQQIVGKTDFDLWPQDLAEQYRRDDEQVITSGEKKCVEELLSNIDGTRTWIETIKMPVLNDEGQVIGTTGTARDINSRKLADEVLRWNEQRLADIINSLPEATWAIDNAGTIIAWNKACEELTGIPAENMLGKGNYEYSLPFYGERRPILIDVALSSTPDVEKNYTSFERREDTVVAEIAIPHFKGGERILLGSARQLFDTTGTVTGAIQSVRDITARKHAEAALQQSERLLTDIIDFLPDATFVIDSAGKIIAWNRACEEMTGFDADTMLGKNNYEYAIPFYGDRRPILIDMALHPDPEKEKTYGKLRREGDTVAGEALQPLLLYKERYLWGTASRLYNTDGNVTGAIESIRDITERKFSEELEHSRTEILEHVAKGKPLEETLDVITRTVERQKRGAICSILLVNETGTRLVHGSAPSLPDYYIKAVNNTKIGLGVGSCGTAAFLKQRVIVDDIDSHPYWRNFQPARDAGLKSCWSEPIISSSGQIIGTLAIYYREHRLPTADEILLIESLASFAGIAIERIKADRALKESEQKYRDLVENANSIILRMDTTGHITFFNEFAQIFFGYSEEEILGQHVVGTIVPEYETSGRDLAEMIAAICADPRKYSLNENENMKKNGERVFVSWANKACAVSTAGTYGEILCVGQDITERKRLQEMMVQTEKMVTVGGLAAGMAHELNNPLGAVVQNTQNIIRRISPGLHANEEAAERLGIEFSQVRAYLDQRGIIEMLQHINASGIRAADIIANMLTFSRKSSSKIEMASLPQVIDKAIELAACDYDLKKQYDFRNIHIIREYAEGLPPIPMNQLEIEQVILNLLKNAAQALSDNPPEKTPQIIIRARAQERNVLLLVEDNGPGICNDLRTRVFEPFFTTKEVGVGTGLGLSVSYSIIVNNHHGTISVDSAPGGGTCFTISLPMAG